MKKRIATKLLSSMLVLIMILSCVHIYPVTAATSDLCLEQNYDVLPTISTTAKTSTHGVWSSAVSSTTGTHVTFSQNTNASDGRTSMRCRVADGRYTVNTYLGFKGASSTSKLSFNVWIPAGSSISAINYIKIGSTTILNETALTAGAWNSIETSAFGSNTSGVIEFQFYNNGGTAGQKYYIDDLVITGSTSSSSSNSSNSSSSTVYSYKMEAKSSSDTSRWRVKLTNSVAAGDIISFYVKPVAASGSTTTGADMYARGNGTKAMYIKNGAETTTAVYSGNHIANNAVACSDGWYYIECVAKAACSSGFELSVDASNVSSGTLGQCLIADVEINGKDVTPVGFNSGSTLSKSSIAEPGGASSGATATPTAKPTATPTAKPTATPTPKPTATPTPKPTATPTPKPTATPTAKPTATPTPSSGTVYSYKMEAKSSSDTSRWRVKLTTSVAVGDVISFYVKPVAASGSTTTGADMYARGDGTKAMYIKNGSETTTAVYSGNHIANNAVACSDGWYYIECVVKAACSSGFELSVDASNVSSGTLGQCLIADVEVNGKDVTPVGFNSGSTLSKSTITKPASGSSDSSEEEDSSTSTTTGFVNIGYLPYYRTDCVDTLDYDALTHICLAFFNPDTSSLEITHKFDSDSEVKTLVRDAQSNGVQVLASYGGASGKTIYTQILTSSSKTTTLVENMVQHALDNGFDGIDIDIEASESYTDIWNNYASFISKLRKRCDEEGLLLTTAVAEWYGDAISSSTLKQFDLVNVMAYDDSGANHSTYEMAIEMCEYFIGRGVSKSKIVMGLPFYGYTANTDMENGTSYKELCENDSSAYNKDLSNGIAYNGIPTIQKKCKYAMSAGYAGVMIWELGQDSTVEKYSLLRAIKLTVYGEEGAR